jgi:excisionase family DNA binding protein
VEIADWITVGQAAQRLHIAHVNVLRAIERKRIRAVRTALGHLVDPASVADYARTRQPVRLKGQRVA